MKIAISVVIMLLLTGCAANYCSSDAECVPRPGCHPTTCVRASYAATLPQPEFCTEEFRFGAAYDEEDCGCLQQRCENLNRFNSAEKSYRSLDKDCKMPECGERVPFKDDIGCGCREMERNYCSERPEVCTQLYDPVCGWFSENIQCPAYPCAQTYPNSCHACADSKVDYWTEGRCAGCMQPQISYAEALTHLQQAAQVVQTHSLCVDILLENGTTIHTKEPEIDDIFKRIQECEECNIVIATE